MRRADAILTVSEFSRAELVERYGLEPGRVTALLDALKQRVFLLHDVHRSGPTLLHSRWAMSYLRGPLTRDEIERLMAGQAAELAAASAAAAAARAPGAPSAAAAPARAAAPSAPVLPAPLRGLYLKQYGGELADAHLFVKYAVRYKDLGERGGVLAWPLSAASPGEVLDGEPVEMDEAQMQSEAPAGVRFGELPSWLSTAGARGLEKALKERLPDELALTLLSDPVTKTSSNPGEDRAAFAARLSSAGGGDQVAKLRDKLEKKQRELAAKQQELSGRKQEKWMAIGTTILSNIGLFTGRKKTISGAGSVLTKNRMENTMEAKVEGLQAEIADLEAQLQQLAEVDPQRFEEVQLVPARTAVKLLRYEIVWVY